MRAQVALQSRGGFRVKPKLLIVHAMAEFIEQGEEDVWCIDFLKKEGLGYHAMVMPSGVVVECCDQGQKIWHARGFNSVSWGLCFVVPGVHTYATFLADMEHGWVNEEQYVHSVDWVLDLQPDSCRQHSDVSPGRKLDPGKGFHFEAWMADLRTRGRDQATLEANTP